MFDGNLRLLENRSVAITGILYPIFLACLQTAIWHWQSSKQQARRSMFFGARVDPQFTTSDSGISILKTFRLRIWGLAFAVVLAYFVFLWRGSEKPEHFVKAILFVFFVPLVGNLMMFGLANRQVAREASVVPVPSTRSASLFIERDEYNVWLTVLDWLVILIPIAMPAVTICVLILYWNQFPPNYRPLVEIGHVLLISVFGLFTGATYFALRFRARSSDWAANPRASRRYRTVLGLIHFFVFGYMIFDSCWLSLMPLLKGGRFGDMNAYFRFTSPEMIFIFLLLVGMMMYLKRNLARDSSDPMRNVYWKWGYFYYNLEDSALVVPSRSGTGFSYNYANRSVWFVGAFIAVAVFFTCVLLFIT